MKLSIIIPALNEAADIETTLLPLQKLRKEEHEVILVDGGSSDQTTAVAKPLTDKVLSTQPGRAHQMNHGAAAASGSALLFLHADTTLPPDFYSDIRDALTRAEWGSFDVKLSGSHPLLKIVASLMNWRSRITGIATGDQAIFIQRHLFKAVGGFPEIPLMEDIAISKKLKQHGKPTRIKKQLITSSRRWEKNGIIRTILLMWRLRLAYFLGVNPQQLAESYRK